MILNEDFFDDINSEDIVNAETEEHDKTYQHSVSVTYTSDGSGLVDENYKKDKHFAAQFDKIYRRIKTLFNNAPFVNDYKINICSRPLDKCNAVRKFGPYDIHYNDSKSDLRMSINIMFDCGYTTLSNIINFFIQLFKSQIADSSFIVDLITIENPKHYSYGDYSIHTYTFLIQIEKELVLSGWSYINNSVKFLSEEFCKPGSYSAYTNRRNIKNGKYLIDKCFSKVMGVKYLHPQAENVYINNSLEEIDIDNYLYGLYNPKNSDGFSAEVGAESTVYTNYDLKNTNPIKIDEKLKEFFKEPHPACVYTFRNSSLKPYLLYCFDETLIIDDIEYVVFIYDACLNTSSAYTKANFIKLMTLYKGSAKDTLDYYKDNFNVQMTADEYEKILSILSNKSYEIKS